MREIRKIDILLDKVGIKTPCMRYWSKPTAESVASYNYWRNMTLLMDGKFNFSGEFDMYISEGMTPQSAYDAIVREWFK